MLAVVLSGGGNHGALEAGALEVFLEAGWKPNLWVGTSAGGINAVMMASNPTLEGIWGLQDLWREARPVPPSVSGLLTVTRRFMTGKDSFFPTEPVLDFARKNMPRGIETFGQLFDRHKNRALTVAVEYPSGKQRVFGEERSDRVIDGIMASSALPPFFSPWQLDSTRYVDGAMSANLPLRVAVEHGADEILALEVHGSFSMLQGSALIDLSSFILSALLAQQTASQLEWVRHEGARVHHIQLDAGPVPGWDFSQPDALLEIGRRTAREYLQTSKNPMPRGMTARWILRRLFRRGPQLRVW